MRVDWCVSSWFRIKNSLSLSDDHRRILEGEKKRGMRGPATRSAFWGCRACKAARDEAAKEAREARRRLGELRDWVGRLDGHEKTVSHHRRRWRTY